MTIAGYKPSQIRKAIIAVIGAVVIIANSVLAEFAEYIPQEAAAWVTSAVAFVTAVSVFLVKNATIIDGPFTTEGVSYNDPA